MSRGKFTRLALTLVGAGAILFALGGTAMAKPKALAKVSQETEEVTLPPQATNFGVLDATAECGRRTTLVGGGAQFSPGTPLGADVELFKSGPFENAWSARFNNNQTVAQPASVSAICLKRNLKVTDVEGKATAKSRVRDVVVQLQLPPQATNSGVAEVDANCPRSTVLVGGGASFSSTVPSLRVALFESGPRGNAWHVRYDNDDVISQPATVTALCLKRKLNVKGGPRKAKARSKVSEVTQEVQLPADLGADPGVAEFDVECPNRTTPVGGGGLFPPGASLPATNIELFESGPRGDGWHVRFNNGLPTPQSVTVHALCLRNKLAVK